MCGSEDSVIFNCLDGTRGFFKINVRQQNLEETAPPPLVLLVPFIYEHVLKAYNVPGTLPDTGNSVLSTADQPWTSGSSYSSGENMIKQTVTSQWWPKQSTHRQHYQLGNRSTKAIFQAQAGSESQTVTTKPLGDCGAYLGLRTAWLSNADKLWRKKTQRGCC